MTDMDEALRIKQVAMAAFGIDLDVQQMILTNIPVSQMAQASLFLSSKKQLYLFVDGKSKLLLGDIRKIVSNMGLKADNYLPPKGQPDYFNEVGRRKFLEVFPGRKQINDEDLFFYKTLAPYHPALVVISEVKNGVVFRFDTDARTGWRPAVKFAYRRIRTS